VSSEISDLAKFLTSRDVRKHRGTLHIKYADKTYD